MSNKPHTPAALAALVSEYRQNEEDNSHSENTALLAAEFGTREDQAIAEAYIAIHAQLGELPKNEGLRTVHYEIQKRCWNFLVDACKVAGVAA